MLIDIDIIDWYHCDIYTRRFIFFEQLIAEAKMDLKGEIYIDFFTKNPKIQKEINAVKKSIEELMFEGRQ